MTAVLSDPSAARAHARSMAGTKVESMPVLPPIADDLPEGVASEDLLWEETIAPGLTVDLRAEMDVTVVVSNCPQINNPCNGFNPTPVRMIVTA